MKTTGSVLVVVGFMVWMGGDLVGLPGAVNLSGLGVLVAGAVLYFVGTRRDRAK